MLYGASSAIPIFISLVVLALGVASTAHAAAPFAAYKGKPRVLIVSAPSAWDLALATQGRWLRAREAGLRDRDVVVIRLLGSRVEGSSRLNTEASALRNVARLPADKFGVALIGKDGSEAFRRSEPITMDVLFAGIDAMPMRREEMARH